MVDRGLAALILGGDPILLCYCRGFHDIYVELCNIFVDA